MSSVHSAFIYRSCQHQRFSLAKLIRECAGALANEHRLSPHHWKVLNTLKECRSGKLGHVVMRCDDCEQNHEFALSCGDRHCPRCSAPRIEQWRAKQTEALLPVPYFHMVFTLPHVLNALIRDNREELYGLLFEKAVEILQQFAEQNYGGKLGITAVLHTWGQTMCEHYHLHLIIPGGVWVAAVSNKGTWLQARPSCLVPVRQVSLCFRAAFLDGVEQLYAAGKLGFYSKESKQRREPGAFRNWLRMAARPKWNVFSEKSKIGPVGAVNYLARYSHRVALNEKRVHPLERGARKQQKLELSYVDNRDSKAKKLALSGVELLKRFSLHILPKGFVRVRHFGFLSSGTRGKLLPKIRQSIARQGLGVMKVPADREQPKKLEALCPQCRQAPLRWLYTVWAASTETELPLIWDSS